MNLLVPKLGFGTSFGTFGTFGTWSLQAEFFPNGDQLGSEGWWDILHPAAPLAPKEFVFLCPRAVHIAPTAGWNEVGWAVVGGVSVNVVGVNGVLGIACESRFPGLWEPAPMAFGTGWAS